MGRSLIIIGVVITIIGLLVHFRGAVPFFGKLPGDMIFRRGQTTVYFPLATGIVLSILATIIINLIMRFFR